MFAQRLHRSPLRGVRNLHEHERIVLAEAVCALPVAVEPLLQIAALTVPMVITHPANGVVLPSASHWWTSHHVMSGRRTDAISCLVMGP